MTVVNINQCHNNEARPNAHQGAYDNDKGVLIAPSLLVAAPENKKQRRKH